MLYYFTAVCSHNHCGCQKIKSVFRVLTSIDNLGLSLKMFIHWDAFLLVDYSNKTYFPKYNMYKFAIKESKFLLLKQEFQNPTQRGDV